MPLTRPNVLFCGKHRPLKCTSSDYTFSSCRETCRSMCMIDSDPKLSQNSRPVIKDHLMSAPTRCISLIFPFSTTLAVAWIRLPLAMRLCKHWTSLAQFDRCERFICQSTSTASVVREMVITLQLGPTYTGIKHIQGCPTRVICIIPVRHVTFKHTSLCFIRHLVKVTSICPRQAQLGAIMSNG